MLMVLEMAPEMNGCAAAIMRMWLSTDRNRLPRRPHGLAQSKTGRCSGLRCANPCGRRGKRVGAVEDGQMLRFEVRRALEGHGPASVLVGGLDVLLREAEV